jgi:hypothetical protein
VVESLCAPAVEGVVGAAEAVGDLGCWYLETARLLDMREHGFLEFVTGAEVVAGVPNYTRSRLLTLPCQ